MARHHHHHVNRTIEQVTDRNIESILCSEDARWHRTPAVYRAIVRISAACGTVGFLIANAVFFAAWVAINEWVVAFDPYPYTFLLFGVSIEAIFLAILILISQNIAAAESERRHHLDLQINLLAERETTAVMRLLVKMAERLDVPQEDQAEVRQFAHDTDPAGVMEQIARAETRYTQHAVQE